PAEGIPADLPALMAADKVLGRVDRPVEGDDLGAELLRLVERAREAGLDAEAELRRAVRRHADG
ncbi:MAG: MazG family protein, partial [Aeromicrobium sp.]